MRVGLVEVGQRPREVAGDDAVERLGLKRGVLGIHNLEVDRETQVAGGMARLQDHARREVDAAHHVTLLGKHEGKKAAAGAHVENAQAMAVRQQGKDLVEPLIVLVAGKLLVVELGKVLGTLRPVVDDVGLYGVPLAVLGGEYAEGVDVGIGHA